MGGGDFSERERLAGLDTKLCMAEYNGNLLRPYRLFVPSSYEDVGDRQLAPLAD